ncbi:MAG: hypothetical protein ABL997_09405 [Planctomycetota bacterium]
MHRLPRSSCLLAGLAACALPATLAAQFDLDARIQKTLERARPALLAHIDAALTAFDPGVLGLVCLAAIHDGVPADDVTLKAALLRLSNAETNQTYALALRLMVMEACPEFPSREQLGKRDLKALLTNRDDGAFGYGPTQGNWDLSNTQYGALGLRAAASMGHDVPRRVWSALAAATEHVQGSKGGFGYTRDGDSPTASMTAAGIGVLSICRQALERQGSSNQAEIDRRIERGWKWLSDHKSWIGNYTAGHCLYFHYGLERAAILNDVTEVGGLDWYATGAAMLVERQSEDGGFSTSIPSGMLPGVEANRGSRGDPVETSFAVLFLRRKFQKIAGPITGARVVTLAALSEQSSDGDVAACAEALGKRGMSAMTEVLTALRSDVVARRRAATAALTTIAGQTFGIDPVAEVERNSEALKKAELWYLKNR